MSHYTVGVILKDKERLQQMLEPYGENNEDFYETYTGDDGEEYSCNPNAKWDWYEIGGRWMDSLKVRKSALCCNGFHFGQSSGKVPRGKYRWTDGARIKDILWSSMNTASQEQIKEAAEFWDGYVENQEPDEDFGFCFSRQYYKDMYETKEDYIMKSNLFYTHSLLLCDEELDQEWIEMGEMGWFGCDNSTKDSLNEYLKRFYDIINNPKYQDYWFIVVDCHI